MQCVCAWWVVGACGDMPVALDCVDLGGGDFQVFAKEQGMSPASCTTIGVAEQNSMSAQTMRQQLSVKQTSIYMFLQFSQFGIRELLVVVQHFLPAAQLFLLGKVTVTSAYTSFARHP